MTDVETNGVTMNNSLTDEEKLKDHCGVIGVYLSDHENIAARLAYYGLQSLQHRGQESTGLAVGDGEKVEHYRSMGRVSEVYHKENLAVLKGHIAIGHVLY